MSVEIWKEKKAISFYLLSRLLINTTVRTVIRTSVGEGTAMQSMEQKNTTFGEKKTLNTMLAPFANIYSQ